MLRNECVTDNRKKKVTLEQCGQKQIPTKIIGLETLKMIICHELKNQPSNVKMSKGSKLWVTLEDNLFCMGILNAEKFVNQQFVKIMVNLRMYLHGKFTMNS